MRFAIIVLLCAFMFASMGLASNPPMAPEVDSMNNDAAIAAVVTFLTGAGLWFVVSGVAAGREQR